MTSLQTYIYQYVNGNFKQTSIPWSVNAYARIIKTEVADEYDFYGHLVRQNQTFHLVGTINDVCDSEIEWVRALDFITLK